jgi:hypothetical protein
MSDRKMETRDEVIEKLLTEHPIEEMVQFSEIDVREKLEKNEFLVVKYTELLHKEKDIFDKIIAMKEKVVGERYDYYRFNYPKELKSAEIEKFYLPKDNKILKINKLLRSQQWRVDFFETAVKALTRMGWNMKSYLQAMKIGI